MRARYCMIALKKIVGKATKTAIIDTARNTGGAALALGGYKLYDKIVKSYGFFGISNNPKVSNNEPENGFNNKH